MAIQAYADLNFSKISKINNIYITNNNRNIHEKT